MKIREIDPPRQFGTGPEGRTALKHCADIELAPDEQVTFIASDGSEHDVVRKAWGYYATPSINNRLRGFGLQAVLARSGDKFFVLLVHDDSHDDFHAYLDEQGMAIVTWLDEAAVAKLEGR